jgi:hypothetical protein
MAGVTLAEFIGAMGVTPDHQTARGWNYAA